MIDYHCHLLPGLDDGAGSVEDSLDMARLLVEAGYVECYCTPHCIRGAYDNTPAKVQAAVVELQNELDYAGIALKLHPGMEYYLDEYFPKMLDDPQPLGVTNMLMVEASPQANPEHVKDNIFAAVRRGFLPLIAHPERYAWLIPDATRKRGLVKKMVRRLFHSSDVGNAIQRYSHNSELSHLQNQGCAFQGNIGSFVGYYGSEVKHRAEMLLSGAVYHYYGTDGHHPRSLKRILQGQGAIPSQPAMVH